MQAATLELLKLLELSQLSSKISLKVDFARLRSDVNWNGDLLLDALDVLNGLMDVWAGDHHLVDPGGKPVLDACDMIASLNKGAAIQHVRLGLPWLQQRCRVKPHLARFSFCSRHDGFACWQPVI